MKSKFGSHHANPRDTEENCSGWGLCQGTKSLLLDGWLSAVSKMVSYREIAKNYRQQHENNNNCIRMVFTMKGCPHELYLLEPLMTIQTCEIGIIIPKIEVSLLVGGSGL